MGQPERDFTLRQLRTFICAARAGSFSHAAAELGISQPAVSDQISLLEDRLGHMLFRRRLGTTPQLTPEGEKLLETAGTLIDTSKAMRCEETGREPQRIRLSIGPRALELYLKPMLPQLYRECPGLHIDLIHRMSRAEVPTALERGRIDLVVQTVNNMPDDWQNSRLACKVMVVMAGPPGVRQKLASGAEQIEDLQFILPSMGSASQNELTRQLLKLGIKPRKPIIYLELADVIQQMVEGGQGVTMLTYEQLASGIAAGRLEIFGPTLPSLQRIIARSDHAPAIACTLADRLAKAMSGPLPGMRSM